MRINNKLLKSKIVQNIGFYTILNLLNSAIPFLLLPFLTNTLSKEQYGIIDLFNNTSFILLPIVGLNIASCVIRFYYDKGIEISKLLSTAINFTFIFGISLFILTIILNSFISVPENYFTLFVCSLLYATFSQISEILLSYYRAIEKPKFYGLFRVSKTFLDFGLTVFILLYVFVGWESRVFTATVVAVLFSIIAVCILQSRHLYSFTLDKEYLKKGILYSSPLIIHSISNYLMSYSDRYFILHFYDIGYVGMYSVAYQIGLVMSFVGNSFNQAYTPFLFQKLSDFNAGTKTLLNKINLYYIIFTVITVVCIYLSLPLIYKYLIGKEFLVDYNIVLIILLSYGTSNIYKLYVNYLFYYKMTTKISVITFISCVINIILCYFLIQKYGLIGAAFATLASFVFQFLFVFLEYKKVKNN